MSILLPAYTACLIISTINAANSHSLEVLASGVLTYSINLKGQFPPTRKIFEAPFRSAETTTESEFLIITILNPDQPFTTEALNSLISDTTPVNSSEALSNLIRPLNLYKHRRTFYNETIAVLTFVKKGYDENIKDISQKHFDSGLSNTLRNYLLVFEFNIRALDVRILVLNSSPHGVNPQYNQEYLQKISSIIDNTSETPLLLLLGDFSGTKKPNLKTEPTSLCGQNEHPYDPMPDDGLSWLWADYVTWSLNQTQSQSSIQFSDLYLDSYDFMKIYPNYLNLETFRRFKIATYPDLKTKNEFKLYNTILRAGDLHEATRSLEGYPQYNHIGFYKTYPTLEILFEPTIQTRLTLGFIPTHTPYSIEETIEELSEANFEAVTGIYPVLVIGFNLNLYLNEETTKNKIDRARVLNNRYSKSKITFEITMTSDVFVLYTNNNYSESDTIEINIENSNLIKIIFVAREHYIDENGFIHIIVDIANDFFQTFVADHNVLLFTWNLQARRTHIRVRGYDSHFQAVMEKVEEKFGILNASFNTSLNWDKSLGNVNPTGDQILSKIQDPNRHQQIATFVVKFEEIHGTN